MKLTSSLTWPCAVDSTSTGLRWPRKKMRMHTTRFTSIGSRVEIAMLIAVRAVSQASSMQKNEIVVNPVSLYILMSSPNVKYETKIVRISRAPAKTAMTEKAGWRMVSLAVASAMVSDFMVVVSGPGDEGRSCD